MPITVILCLELVKESFCESFTIGITHHFCLPFSGISALPSSNNSRRNHPSLTINLESGSDTKQATFLGIAHGFLGDSFCAIMNGA